MSRSKYSIENTIAMQAGFRHLVQQVDFEDADVRKTLRNNPCHIYMICSRPKITIPDDGVQIDTNSYRISFAKHFPDKIEIVESEFENNLGFYTYNLNAARNRIVLRNKDGDILTDGKVSLLYPTCISEYDPVLDLKVLYIGQAFGTDGSRVASDRLMEHSTLQKIYSDAMDSKPTKDIWLIMWQFSPYFISMFGAAIKNPIKGMDESIDNYNRVVQARIPNDQQITITEAAMIRYFSPAYNKEYKTTFPDGSHASYEICFELDLNSVAFELDTVSIVTRLYSDVVVPAQFHIKHYNLHDENERQDMFRLDFAE